MVAKKPSREVWPYCVPADEEIFWTPPGADGDAGAVLTLGVTSRSPGTPRLNAANRSLDWY